jgi:hypothetical protein
MDATRVRVRREEQGQRSSHRHPRVADTNQNFGRRNKGLRNEYAGCLALFGRSEVGRVLSESKLAGPRVFGRSQASELNRPVTDQFSLEFFGNLSSGERHRLL